MPAGLIQMNLNGTATIVIAVVILILAVTMSVLLFVRSSVQRREREERVRQRMLEMERESQFASAADLVPPSRRPGEVASHIAGLFREYLSVRVLAVYAGHESQASLLNISDPPDASAQPRSTQLPPIVRSSLLTEHAQPAVVNGSVLGKQATGELIVSQPATDHSEVQAPDVSVDPNPVEAHDGESSPENIAVGKPNAISDDEVAQGGVLDQVMLLPWHGPFGWNGLIVGSVPGGLLLDALDPYREPLARLTDRLAIALEFQQNDSAIAAFDDRASRSTEFSRAVVSCLEEPAPFDAIVREVTKLVDADSSGLWRVDPASGMVRLVAAYGLKMPEFLPLPVGQGLSGSVAQTGETLAIEDAPADPRCIFPREAREAGIVSYLGAALSVASQNLGVIEVHSSSRRLWTNADRQALESAGKVISELIKSTDSRGNRLRVESAYLGLSEALQRLRTPDEVKEAVVEVLGHALGASRVLIVEFNDSGGTVPVRQEYRQPSVKSALDATFEETLVSRVSSAVGTQPIAIPDSHEHSLIGPDKSAGLDVVSELAVPIRTDGKTNAIVYVHQCDRVRDWEHEEIEFAERVARQLALSLTNLRSREQANVDAQEARDEAKKASESGSRSRAMLSALPEIVVGLDREGRVSFFNSVAADRLGLNREDLGGPAKALEQASDIWPKITGSPRLTRFDAQLKLKSDSNNGVTPVSISVAPLSNDKGELAGRLVVVSDVSHLKTANATEQIRQLEEKLKSIERVLNHSRDLEERARLMHAEKSALEANARQEAVAARQAEAELRHEFERVQQDYKQVQASSQQLLEINKLKSEFIVNSGHEIEGSLQSVLGLAELLERGSYGELSVEQREAVHSLYGWARRIKGDVDWLLEYGSARSRRLESTGGD